jgi:hypothetical protein
MSNEKKNKGRDPAAQINDSPVSRLVQKFLEMKETDYVRIVVIPVLEAEGFERIDFHHGSTEVGKDLIFSKNIEFGKKSLIVAVVKCEKLSKSSSDASGLPVILTQVDQAKRNEVMSWDGTKRRPDQVLVILADDPSHDVISSNPGGFEDRIIEGVRFILGADIATSLLEHRKDIAEQILGSKLDTSAFLEKHSTNLPLLHALHSNELVDIQTIFTDLDAAVGTTSISHALSLRPSGVNRVVVADPMWTSVSHAIHKIEKVLGTVLAEPLATVEKNYLIVNQTAKSPANVKTWAALDEKAGEIQNTITTIRQELQRRHTALSAELGKSTVSECLESTLIEEALKLCLAVGDGTDGVLAAATKVRHKGDVAVDVALMLDEHTKYSNVVESAKAKYLKIEGMTKTIQVGKSTLMILQELGKSINLDAENAQNFAKAGRQMLERAKRFVPSAKHEVIFDVLKLRQQIESHLASLVLRFQSQEISTNRDYSRCLLEDVRQYLSAIDAFTSIPELSVVLKPIEEKPDSVPRLGACILGLLNSGVDVLVTGNAGSGKSTTLEMFARQSFKHRGKNEEVMFLPLAKLASTDVVSLIADPINHFCDEVARLFRATEPGVTSKFIKERIDSANRLVLVLDGIDEASGLVAWILDLIDKLRKLKRDGLQVVASSRFGEPQLEAAGLLKIQLLPFRPEQVSRFILDFLSNDPELANDVIAHLNRNPTMFSVAQTPLMSTILCILAQNGVVLPETKSALYKERFALLWGAYDAKKQVHRVKSSTACLEDVSKKAAHYLHSHHIRSASRANILAYVQEALVRKYRTEFVCVALEELERPCNVIVEEVDGSIGFGHLSYQEYLVSDELYTNRSGDIVSHLADPWWRGVLVLVAMKAEDIGSIIQQRFMQEGSIGGAAETLNAMIEVCEDRQKNILSNILRKQERLDHLVDLEYGGDESEEYR